MTYSTHITELNEKGYSVTAPLYSEHEVAQILTCIENAEQNEKAFLKTNDLFAIRQLLKHVPKLNEVLFNKNLKALVSSISANTYFLTKAIYFDKPSNSNWFVAYHQDLSISVDRKVAVDGYTNWTFKKEQYGVQPPLNILQDTVTIRIHLDTTNENNGALKVIPASHLHGIIRMDSKEGLNFENEHICNVTKGGVMLMKPLTLHASNRTTNGKQRRVIHLEFNKQKLHSPLNWLEQHTVNFIT
ncbi:MAG: phytanoyl-CoA dioxygenase [Crocinitomicaceae bacterium]|nr:phytanoyl-CoA dioxygenase [Crocinitomicaceae bacterium]|tara:strand:+ start:5990 stop:6721 length:732 start_codon:yes stop_codon:yes gene_type:complete